MAKRILSNNIMDRHIAITDGVFAIAMTILVLEFAVPAVSNISSEIALNDYLLSYLAPSIFIYFISFYLVYNFWESTTILFCFKNIKQSVLLLNMLTMATVCLIPFATGFLFEFYHFTEVNIIFSLLILIISLLYILMFILLLRNNFNGYFEKKDELKSKLDIKVQDGFEFENLKLYVKGTSLTLFYILVSPLLISIVSLILAFFSPLWSILSFLLILILNFLIRFRRSSKEDIGNIELTDDEKEFINDIKNSIYL